MHLTRRKLLAAGSALALLPRAGRSAPPLADDPESPIATVKAGSDSWGGDAPAAPHSLLRDRPPPEGPTEPTESAGVVVVGGGLAGLAVAWLLRDRGPVLLEQGARFGGNCRGERWQGVDYPIGSAYFAAAPKKSMLSRTFYRPLGLHRLWTRMEGGAFLFGGSPVRGFWEGATDPAAASRFRAAEAYFRDVAENRYPDMPPGEWRVLSDEELAALDRLTFREEVERGLGGPLHPHLHAALELYCWSAFGASMEELSAAAGLNFYAAEFEPACFLPGGNACLAARLLDGLRASPARVRAGATVLRIGPVTGGRVEVVYDAGNGRIAAVAAPAVVVACPKYVAHRIVADLPPEQREAMRALRYRAYTTASVLCDAAPASDLDDLFALPAEPPPVSQAPALGATDAIVSRGRDRSAVTLYRALPYDGGRAELMGESFSRFREDATRQSAAMLPALGLPAVRATGLRLARFGHALPIAAPGLVAGGTCAAARAPVGGRVFFANQDDWALPSVETCLTRAIEVGAQVRAVSG